VSNAKPTGLVVPHTHWDREWRYPLWATRAMLVDLMDQLLDLLEADAEYRCFVLDGQCIPVEDYLEIRPAQRERVGRLVAADRLKIGPWYTLPEPAPLDGECLVRNLLRGIRFCREFGGHLRVGYNSFGWGQPAQFPQIHAGFGFDFVIAAKRVSERRAPCCEFWWEAPDGTRILATRLGKDARANGFFQAYIPVRFGVEYASDDYRFRWGATGQVMHPADPSRVHEDYIRVDREDGYHADQIREGFQAAWEAMADSMPSDYRLILNGSDFTGPQPILTRLIRDANATFDDRQFVLGTLEEYAAEVQRRLSGGEVPVVRGELRDGPASACSANALAVRVPLKQMNRRAEHILLRRAEPLACLMAMLGAEYPRSMLDRAWKYLLRAHPHDSIGGVAQDKTADDVAYRMSQAIEIGEVVHQRAVAELIRRVDLSSHQPEEQLLLVVNPLPYPTRGVLEVCVDTPVENNVWEVGLRDVAGRTLEVQPIAREQSNCPIHDPETRPWPFHFDRHTLYVDPGEIPAGGYRLLSVVPRQHHPRNMQWWPPMRASRGQDIARRVDCLENEHLRVDIQPDGTFHLTDKASGRTIENLHYFEDTGDAGDFWAYYPPHHNRTFISRGQPSSINLEQNGPLAASVVIQLEMLVPTHADVPTRAEHRASRRTESRGALAIQSRLTLRRGSPWLEVVTTVNNTARDHRLRLMIPSDVATNHAEAGGHFHVDRRPLYPARDGSDAFHPEMQTLPMQAFVDVSDGQRGMAVLGSDIMEYQLLDDDRRTLALTLFRSVRNRICSEARSTGDFPHQDGAQLLQPLQFAYALYPHAGDWQEARLPARALLLAAGPRVYQTNSGKACQASSERRALPPEASLWRIEPDELIVSALKQAEDRTGYIVRVFNPTGHTVDARLSFPFDIVEAYITDLNEDRQSAATLSGKRTVCVEVTARKITTIEIG